MAKPIVINQTGSATVIAAEAGKTVLVFSYMLSCSAEVVIRFDDTDDVPLTGPMTIAAKGNLPSPYSPDSQFETAAGKGVKLVFVSGSGTLGGYLGYNAY